MAYCRIHMCGATDLACPYCEVASRIAPATDAPITDAEIEQAERFAGAIMEWTYKRLIARIRSSEAVNAEYRDALHEGIGIYSGDVRNDWRAKVCKLLEDRK